MMIRLLHHALGHARYKVVVIQSPVRKKKSRKPYDFI
jgi:hypothetical protein